MSMVATDIKDLFSINIKSRHDSLSDQFNRIFMVKLFLVCSIVTGISWYTDSVNCIIPDLHAIDGDDKFVPGACWIRGFFVYKQLQTRFDKIAYFGIPKDIDMDGMMPDGTLCTTQYQLSREPNPDCKPMEKTFYLQYQWMPFLIAALGLMFYMPYMVFRLFNNDLVTLREQVKSDEPDAEKIVKRYFRNRRKSFITTLMRLLMNMSVKILYLVANVVAFVGLDNILNKEFRTYGKSWIDWSKTNNTIQYDYMGRRDFPKPGNLLLPPFGYCEVFESAKDIKFKVGNQHKFVCEISQHVLYQYCLIVLWFALIVGVVMSLIGILVLLVRYILGVCRIRKITGLDKKLYDSLSFRQLEYLEFMKKKKMDLYGEVMSLLHRQLAAGNTANGGVKL